MTETVEDYLQAVRSHLRVPRRQKTAIVEELRTHLLERVREEQAREPDRARAEIEQAVVRRFGDPAELAVAYEADGPVLKRSTGEVALRLSKAAGRGAKTVLKWSAIGLGLLLLIGGVVGVWAFYEVLPAAADVAEYHIHSGGGTCSLLDCPEAAEETFVVHEGTHELEFGVWLHEVDFEQGATVRVTVTDPNGTVKYDRQLQAKDDRPVAETRSWSAVPGEWTVKYQYTGTEVTVSTGVDGIGFPEHARVPR